MAEEIAGWNISARLSVDDADFKAKLREAEQAVQQSRRQMRSAAGGTGPVTSGPAAAAGGTVMLGGRRMPVADAARYLGVDPGDLGGGGPPPRGPAAAAAGGGGRSGGGWTLAPPPIRAAAQAEDVNRANVAFAGPNMIGESRARAKALRDEEAASKGNRRELGLRTAYMLRAATSGGFAGMAGGGLGALAGLIPGLGGPGFGALIGNQVGQAVGGIPGHLRNVVGGSAEGRGAAYQFDRAVADVQGVIGRSLVPTLDYFTQKTRLVGDAMSANESSIRKVGEGFTAAIEFGMEFTGLNQKLRQEAALRPGGSRGAGVSPLQGHIFGSADDVYRAISSNTMLGLNAPKPGMMGTVVGPEAGQAINDAVRAGGGMLGQGPPDPVGGVRQMADFYRKEIFGGGAPKDQTPVGPMHDQLEQQKRWAEYDRMRIHENLGPPVIK